MVCEGYGLSVRTEDTGDQPTPLELQRIREGLRREMIREVESLARAGKLPGNLPGFLKQEFQMAGAAQIPWQDLLSRFMSGLRRSDFRSFPFNIPFMCLHPHDSEIRESHVALEKVSQQRILAT